MHLNILNRLFSIETNVVMLICFQGTVFAGGISRFISAIRYSCVTHVMLGSRLFASRIPQEFSNKSWSVTHSVFYRSQDEQHESIKADGRVNDLAEAVDLIIQFTTTT